MQRSYIEVGENEVYVIKRLKSIKLSKVHFIYQALVF